MRGGGGVQTPLKNITTFVNSPLLALDLNDKKMCKDMTFKKIVSILPIYSNPTDHLTYYRKKKNPQTVFNSSKFIVVAKT